jgi:hypothetical protein
MHGDLFEGQMEKNHFKSKDKVEIVIKNSYTPKKYAIIPLPRKQRPYFPGFRVPFTLITDIGEIAVLVAAAQPPSSVGDPLAGKRIQGGLKPWFKVHDEITDGTKLVFEIVVPMKKYRLRIEN